MSRKPGLMIVGFAALGVVLGARASDAAPITYTLNQVIGAGSVTGTIQTDGTVGTLSAGDITAFNLNLNGVGATYNLTSATSALRLIGSDLTASLTALYFNFSGTDNGSLLFQQTLLSGQHYYCDATSTGDCYQGATVAPQAYNDSSAQTSPRIGNLVIGTASVAVPEPVSLAVMAAGLVGFAVIRRRRPKDCAAGVSS